MLELLEPPGAAEVLASISPGSAATVLRRLPDASLAGLMDELPGTVSGAIRQLLRYSPEQAGSRLDPRAPAVHGDLTAEEALGSVRRHAAGALHYVYVLANECQLVGVANLRELMLAEPGQRVENLMVRDPWKLRATERLETIVRHPAWSQVHALPVVDGSDRFLGVIRYSAFRAMQSELGRALVAPHPTRAASALAELLGLGAGAMAHLAGVALTAAPAPGEGTHDR